MIGRTVGLIMMMRLMLKGMTTMMMMIGRRCRRRRSADSAAGVLGRRMIDGEILVDDAEARKFVPVAGQIGVSADAQLLPS